MGLAQIPAFSTLLVAWVALVLCLAASGVRGAGKVRILKAPKAFSSSKTAAFEFEVVDCPNCSPRCKLDSQAFTSCEVNGVSYIDLFDGEHKFDVCINMPDGANCDSYSWTVDTISPTASISAASAFTSALNVSVNISFSEPCTGGGGFRCFRDDCNLLVYGAGYVMPSTLRILQQNMMYGLSVKISPEVPYGRIVLVMDRGFCSDAAGNRFLRTASSRYFLHFDRRNVSVLIDTPIPEMLIPLNNVAREVEATNNVKNLRIYLQFSKPVLNSSAEILKVLHTSIGVLLPTNQSRLGNRRFTFLVRNVPSIAIITVGLETSSIISRYGAPVSGTDPQTFLYDVERPSVKLSTPSSRTRQHTVPVIIKFVKAVFNFNASALQISGGNVIGFHKISRNLYSAGIQFIENTIAITVPESIASDVAGNMNLASNLLLVHRYHAPTVSNALAMITSAIFAVTCFVAILLTVSTSTLSAFGAITGSSSYVSEPSRSIMRIVYHIQVFAQSKWLPVTLPIEYYELLRGIQWSIPYLSPPWESKEMDFSCMDMSCYAANFSEASEAEKLFKSPLLPTSTGKFRSNTSQNGAPLTPMEYMTFFEDQNLKPQAEFIALSRNSHRWKEFQCNIVWLAVFGVSLIVLHALILLVIKLRKKISETNRSCGALVFPRFEIFLMFLALPCICQASATIIRGKSLGGVITGSLLLVVVAVFLLFLLFFISIGITMGKFLQYKEVLREGQALQWYHGIIHASLGPGKRGQWTWKDRPDSVLLARLGPLFEDFRGPPKHSVSQITGKESTIKSNKKVVASEDEIEDTKATFIQKFIAMLRIYYTLLDSIKRISLGIISGLYSSGHTLRRPILIVLSITTFQLFFLALTKPFIMKKVQFVELLSVSAEVGIFVTCLVLFKDLSEDQQQTAGYFMLALFAVTFVTQTINEWYALYRQILRLSPDEDSFLWGLRTVMIGLLLIFFPPKFLSGWDDRLSSDRGEGESRSSMSTGGQKENNSGGNERSWIRQLREIAKESFSRDDGKDPSSSQQKQTGSLPMSSSSEVGGKSKTLRKDLQSIFSSN